MATIPIVEDEPQISLLLQSLFEEQGHTTFSAATANEALTILTGPKTVDALFVVGSGPSHVILGRGILWRSIWENP
jgi:CheY-like chemotaxis protein